MNTLQNIIIFTELVKDGFKSNDAGELFRILNETVPDENAMQLRQKANEIIARELNCDLITDKETAGQALNNFSGYSHRHLFWIIVAELYKSV